MPTRIYIALALAFVACSPQDNKNCGNEIDVGGCEPDGSVCFCGAGPEQGEACTPPELTTESDPDSCENLCLFCEEPEAAGPESVLLGM